MPRPLSLAVGFGVALAAWLLFGGAYHALLGSFAGALFPGRGEGGVAVAMRGDALVAGPVERPEVRATVPLRVVSSNLVLLGALWGWARPRRWWGVAGAVAAVTAGHLVAVVAGVHAVVAVGPGGEGRYGALEANVWFGLWQGYQVVGGWALAFGAWWMGVELSGEGSRGSRARRGRGRARRRE